MFCFAPHRGACGVHTSTNVEKCPCMSVCRRHMQGSVARQSTRSAAIHVLEPYRRRKNKKRAPSCGGPPVDLIKFQWATFARRPYPSRPLDLSTRKGISFKVRFLNPINNAYFLSSFPTTPIEIKLDRWEDHYRRGNFVFAPSVGF